MLTIVVGDVEVNTDEQIKIRHFSAFRLRDASALTNEQAVQNPCLYAHAHSVLMF